VRPGRWIPGIDRLFCVGSEYERVAFGHDADAFTDAHGFGGGDEAGGRFVEGFVTEAEGAVVHGDESFCAEIGEGANGILGVHVDFTSAGRIVGTDGQERDVDVETAADFGEAFEVCSVAAVKDGAAFGLDDEASEAAMGIVQKACAPVVAGGERDAQGAEFVGLPVVEFVDATEPEVVHKVSHFERDDDGLVAGDFSQGAFVEMIEVGVCDEDGVDVGEFVEVESGMAHTFDNLEPLRPVGIDEQAVTVHLQEEGCVADPGDADLAFCEFGESCWNMRAAAFLEE